jgi:hypothetical protein
METRIAVLMTIVAACWTSRADLATPAKSGFAAVSGTFYVNTNADLLNLGNPSQHTGVDIAANGNIMIGWENDGSPGITDFEAVWTLYTPNGTPLISPTVQTNRDVSGNGECGTSYESVTSPWLSFFRDDNTPIGGYTGWGGYFPKANRFGNGIGSGAFCYETGLEILELADINGASGGDFGVVQLLNNDGTPFRPGVINGLTNLGILSFTETDVAPSGNLWAADFDYLANGNIVVAGMSEKDGDWDLTGQTDGYVPVYRVWTPGGVPVHDYAAASSEPIGGDLIRGVGVTANGFALRWNQEHGGNATMRLFDNAGNPTSTNINLATLTGHPEVASGGNGSGGDVGQGSGFHGNGVDAYVYANSGGTPGTPWVTVINADGTLRWSREVQDDSDPIDTSTVADLDAAIDPSGRVIVVFSSPAATNVDGTVYSLTQARLFDKTGKPLGPRFVVSEIENQATTTEYPFTIDSALEPRVAWRGNNVAFVWLSQSSPGNWQFPVVAARVLAAPITLTSVSHTGTTTTINWTGGTPPYSLQRKNPLTGSWSIVKTGITGTTTTYIDSVTQAYYQVLCSQ